MILTRIQRGAVRTQLLIRSHLLKQFRDLGMNRSFNRSFPNNRILRSTAATLLAAYTVVLPIPLSAPASLALAAGEDSDPLPHSYAVETNVKRSLYFTDRSIEVVGVSPAVLQPIAIGKSFATEREEELVRQRQAELERARQAQLQLQRKAAEERKHQEEIRRKVLATQELRLVSPAVAFHNSPEDIARVKVSQAFGDDQWEAFRGLINRESHFNPFSVNKRSGACGIPQALPCSKLLKVVGSLENVAGQIEWTISYIRARYGTPQKALSHSLARGWY